MCATSYLLCRDTLPLAVPHVRQLFQPQAESALPPVIACSRAHRSKAADIIAHSISDQGAETRQDQQHQVIAQLPKRTDRYPNRCPDKGHHDQEGLVGLLRADLGQKLLGVPDPSAVPWTMTGGGGVDRLVASGVANPGPGAAIKYRSCGTW